MVQQLATCNIPQAGFVARFCEEYLDGMLSSRPLTRALVDACLNRLFEVRLLWLYYAMRTNPGAQIQSTDARQLLETLHHTLQILLRVRSEYYEYPSLMFL